METREVDVAIIGAGTAGLNARREVEKSGRTALMIESGPYGTTCARVGCMPSKLLIAAADAAHGMEHAKVFGVEMNDGYRVDGKAVMERVRTLRDGFAGGVARATEALPEKVRLKGRARFTGPNTLEVDEHTRVHAKTVIIATGSSPWTPAPFDALKERVLVNDDVFEWEDLPRSIAVVGTGIIGLELGQALSRLGVEVAFFNPFEAIGPYSDPVVAAAARKTFSEDLNLHLGIKDVQATLVGEEVEIAWTEDGKEQSRRFEYVLSAAGRRPNLKGMGLELTELTLDKRGMPTWDPTTCQCEDSSIFMAGDVTGHRPLLHEASDEGSIAGENASNYVSWGQAEVQPRTRRTSLAIAFTEPQMALVGKRFADHDLDTIVIGEVSFENQGRAKVMAENRGLLRLYAEKKTCTLLGAEMFGPRVEHMAQLIAWAIQQKLTVPAILAMPFYHPVLEEGLRTALRDLAAQLEVVGGCHRTDMNPLVGD